MKNKILLFSLIPVILTVCCCAGNAAAAEEYFSIGMAYFDLGKYEEAEIWLSRARGADRTMTASQYNLGRIAFEMQRYDEAALLFEGILEKDPDNVLALRAASYTRIRTGDFFAADRHYTRLLELVPESADDGYNHALVLYAMQRYAQAEEALARYPLSLYENKDRLLLYARSQGAQKKIEAIDSYSLWLEKNTGADARFEYALILEENMLYARAIEEYEKVLTEISSGAANLARGGVHFALARVYLTADPQGSDGIRELNAAINEGFDDTAAIEALLKDEKAAETHHEEIRRILFELQRADTSSEINP